MLEDKPKGETTGEHPKPDRARREALAKMGRFAAYTGPVMLGLLGSSKARAIVSGPAPPTVVF
jgi:hypothetical protein